MVRKCLNGIFLVLIFGGIVGILLLQVPRLFRIKPQIVLSGSMEPEIPVGSMAYITEAVRAEDIRKGDIIAYQLGESMEVLHRVIQADAKQRSFITKGDANRQADLGQVSFSQYKGKEVFRLPYVGYMAQFLQTGRNLFLIMCGIAGLIIIDEIWRRREGGQQICRKQKGKRRKQER